MNRSRAGAVCLLILGASGRAGEGVDKAAVYAEGIDTFDVDGDGRVDLLAGNYWFKHEGWEPIPGMLLCMHNYAKTNHDRAA